MSKPTPVFTPAALRYNFGAVNVLLTIASAVLLPLALPNELFQWGMTLPGLVALVPVLVVVYRVPERRAASRHGMLFGALTTAIGNYWLAFFGEFSVWTIGGAVLGYVGYNYILFGYLHYLAHHGSKFLRPLLIATVWTGYEYLKSVGFLGYPWGLVAYPLARINLVAQTAEIAGVWALSFIASYINAAIAELAVAGEARAGLPSAPVVPAARAPRHFARVKPPKVRGGRPAEGPPFTLGRGLARDAVPAKHALAAAAVLLVAAAFGAWRMPRIEPNDSLSLLLVQQNVDSWAPGRFADALEQAQRLTLDELRRHRGESDASSPRPVDAVVWSETALRRPYRGPDDYYRSLPEVQPFTQFLRTIDRPLITGSALPAGADGRDATNSALVIRPDGRLIGSYAKQQLVPFAESIPFWDVPVVKRFFRNVVGLYGTWIPGDRSNTVSLPLSNGEEVPVGLPICFEDAFGWVPRELVNNGAEVLINLTNNSWSRQDSAQTQHFVAARLRTIELRTPLVRSTNSGLTTVVDAHGVASQSLPMFESASRVVQVPMYSDTWTLYRAWGDWLGIAAVAAALLTVVATAVRSRPELGRRATGGPAGR